MQTMPSRYRVLVADDAPAVRQALRWVLAEIPDLEIVGEASDGTETLQLAQETKPHLVILDIQMPGMDGYAVTPLLKQMPEPPRVILLTGQTEPNGAERARLAGSDGYVEKTMGWTKFFDEIRKVLDKADEK